MSPKWKAGLILTGVFLLGGAAGAGAGRAYTFYALRRVMSGPPEGRSRMQVELMKRELDLDDAQVTKLEAILKDMQPEREHAMEPCRAEMDSLRQRTDARILEVLRPEQRSKYEESKAKRGWKHGDAPSASAP